MPSKTSYFNGTLFRKNLSRFWPLWGMASFSGAMLPLSLLVSQLKEGGSLEPLMMTNFYYGVLVYVVPTLSFLYAGFCAMAVWSYLYAPRSVGLMHTLPIRREGLFFTGVLSGLTMMAIPYVVTGSLTVLVTLLWGGFDPVGVAVTVLGVAGESILFFGIATFCAFIVGNIFSLPALYILLNFLAPLLEWTVAMLSAGFCFGLTALYSGTMEFLSPLLFLLRKVHYRAIFADDTLSGPAFLYGQDIVGVKLEGGWIIAVYTAVGVVFLILSYLLYRHRRSESAGDVVSAPWMRPIFRFVYSGLAAILGGRFLYAILWESFQTTDFFDIVPIALCMMVCAAVGYLSTNMALAKSPRVWKQSWRGMLVAAGCCIVFCLGMEWDLLGVERRVPATSAIESVHLFSAEADFMLYAGQDDALIEELRQIHRAIASDKAYVLTHTAQVRAGAFEDRLAYGGDLSFTSVELTYKLKNGTTLWRAYWVPMERSRLQTADTYDAKLDALINSAPMCLKRIRWQDETAKLIKVELNTPMLGIEQLSTRQYTALLNALAEDAKAGRWKRYDWFDPRNSADGTHYPIFLSLEYRRPDTTLRGAIRLSDPSINISGDMTATMATLRELGLLTDLDLVEAKVFRPWAYYESDSDDGWDEYERFQEAFGMNPEEYYRQNGGQYPEGWFDGTGGGDAA